MFDILAVGWSGKNLTGEQMLALRDAAVKFLRAGTKRSVTNFRHDSCEGTLRRGKSTVYNGISGTLFHADLGTVKGERWTMEFLIPNGTEHIVVTDDTVALFSSSMSSDTGFNETEVVVRDKKRTVH